MRDYRGPLDGVGHGARGAAPRLGTAGVSSRRATTPRSRRSSRASFNPCPASLAALDRIALPSCVASSGPHHKMAVTLRHDRAVGALRGAHLQRHRGRGRQAGARPLPARRRAAWASTRRARPSSRTACRASRPPSRRACARSHSRATVSAAELAAAGGEPFADMAELPALLAHERHDRPQGRRHRRRAGRLLSRLRAARGTAAGRRGLGAQLRRRQRRRAISKARRTRSPSSCCGVARARATRRSRTCS